MTSEPVSRLPDPKYAEALAESRQDAEFWARKDDALRTAIAERDEARADTAHEKQIALLACEDALGFKARAEAAEARLEELTRERDELLGRNEAEQALKGIGLNVGGAFKETCRKFIEEADAAKAVASTLGQKLELAEARLEEAKAVLGQTEARLVALYRGASPHANYDSELGINGHRSGNRFADTDEAVLAVRAFLHQGGEDAR